MLATFIVYFHHGCSEKRGNIEEVYMSDMVKMMEVCSASFEPMQKGNVSHHQVLKLILMTI